MIANLCHVQKTCRRHLADQDAVKLIKLSFSLNKVNKEIIAREMSTQTRICQKKNAEISITSARMKSKNEHIVEEKLLTLFIKKTPRMMGLIES